MKYRSEIDGLRALAVLPVMCFHAGLGVFSGGFVGVDVFFVISGYLITQIILEEIARGEFSITRFYARRARRILPALFFVMLVCIPFAFWWMLPSQYADFSRSLIAVVLFVSNIFFWRESGYFAAAAEEKPLLHTWSLGVEEQYYMLFPIALVLAMRFGRRPAFWGVMAVTAVSFGLCEYASRVMPSANFFLIPTRAWELFAGSICAFIAKGSEGRKNNLLSAAGLGLIVFSMVCYDEYMRLPSAYALVPVIGTMLVLLYGTAGSWAARVLSLRVFVWVGLISYSAYLWHQPLFAFARIHSFDTPRAPVMLALLAAALVLAAFTWRFVEMPFRKKQHPRFVANRPALVLAVLVAALLVAAGVYGHLTKGRLEYWKSKADAPQARAYLLINQARQATHVFDNGDCIFTANALSDETESRLASCREKYGAGIAIIGDSHAMNMFFVLKEHAGERPFIAGIAQGMCRPHSPLPNCYYDKFVALLERQPGIFRDVIYEQAGSHLLKDMHGKDTDQASFFDLPLDAAVPEFMPHLDYIDAVAKYLSKLARHSHVVWLGPRVEPQIRENAVITLGCNHTFSLRPNQMPVFRRLDSAIRQHLEGSAIDYRSQLELMRFDMSQEFISCEKTYWTDGNHYSPEGELYFSNRITLDALLGKGAK